MTDRLAVYGTLRPGHPNAHELASIAGTWTSGTVRGHRRDDGWQGYPGLDLTDDGPQVPVEVLTSKELVDHWDRLDEFEGEGYRRVSVTVQTAAGPVQAQIYVLAR